MTITYIRTIFIFIALSISPQLFAQVSVWVTHFGGANQAMEHGDYEKAEYLFRSAIGEFEYIAKEEPQMAPGMMSDTLSGLSAALHGQEKFSAAEAVTRKQLLLIEMTSGKSSDNYIASLNNLGLLLSEQSKFSEAETTHRTAIKLSEKYEKPPRRQVAFGFMNLGKVYYDQGKYTKAEPLFNQALQIFFKISPNEFTSSDTGAIARINNNLGLISTSHKKYDVAESYYKVAITITEKFKGSRHPDLILYLNNYAKLLRLTKRFDEASFVENHIALIKNGPNE